MTTAKTPLDNELSRRGILHAARAAQWTPNRDGWRYPIRDMAGRIVTYRWKAAPGQGGGKYAWLPNKPDNAIYYHPRPQTLPAAIAAADGVLYIANGEPALLSFIAAGIENAVCWFGEGSVPPSLAADLQAWGVREVRYPADKDTAGVKSAVKVRDALKGSKIAYKPLLWGADVPDKGDANDYWIACGFDRAAFQQGIANLDALPLPESAEREPRRYDFGSDNSETPAALIEAIGRALDAPPPNSKGWTRRNICSPLRPDKNPTCGFNWHSGVLHDFGTGESHGPRALADHFGIDWREYYPRRERPQKRRRPAGQAAQQGNMQRPPAAAKPALKDRIQPVTLPTFTAQQTVSGRYVSDVLSPADLDAAGLVCLKSATGTGKTELMKRSIDARAGSVLYITGLKSLNRNAADRLALEYYSDLDLSTFGAPARLAITPNSLHKIGSTRYDTVIIDEATQVLPVLTDGPMKGSEAAAAYGAFQRVTQNARRVIALDAHMTDTHADLLAKITRKPAHKIENSYRADLGTLTLHESYSTVLAAALDAIEQGQATVITTDSKSFARMAHELMTARVGTDGIRLVTGDNSGNADSQQFIKHINEELPALRCLITTPSLGTGIDITAPVDAVFGVFTNHAPTATDFVQAVRRYRNAASVQVYIRPAQRELETDVKAIFQRYDRAAAATATAAGLGGYADAAQLALLVLHAHLDAARNAQRNDALSFFAAYAEREGYALALRAGSNDAIREAVKAARERLDERDQHLTLTSDALSPDDLDALKMQAVDITPEHLAGVQRWRIERVTGQGVTDEHYADLHRQADRRRVYMRALLLRTEDAVKEFDRAEIDNGELLHRRSHKWHRVRLLDSMTRALWGLSAHDLHGGAAPAAIDRAELADRLAAWVDANLDAVRRFIDARADLSADPARLVNRVLKAFGFALKGQQERIAGTDQRHTVYTLDADYSTKWAGYAALLLAAEERRQATDSSMSTNTRTEYINPAFVDKPAPAGRPPSPTGPYHAPSAGQMEKFNPQYLDF